MTPPNPNPSTNPKIIGNTQNKKYKRIIGIKMRDLAIIGRPKLIRKLSRNVLSCAHPLSQLISILV